MRLENTSQRASTFWECPSYKCMRDAAFYSATFRYASWAVCASTGFIHLLFIYWKYHVTDGQNRSLFFRVKRMPTYFNIFLLLPSYFFSPLEYSIDTSRCYRTSSVL